MIRGLSFKFRGYACVAWDNVPVDTTRLRPPPPPDQYTSRPLAPENLSKVKYQGVPQEMFSWFIVYIVDGYIPFIKCYFL